MAIYRQIQIYPIQGVSQKEQEEEKEKEKTAAEEKETPSVPAAVIILPENEKDVNIIVVA
jgi:hypothetical protein